MAKNKLVFEKDEKKSIIIALIVSAVVVLAAVLTFVAIQKNNGKLVEVATETETITTENIIAEDGSYVVTNQTELEEKLVESTSEESVISAITIMSDEEQSLNIPEADYSDLTLTVDAPYTEIENHAIFNSVSINQISANTWTEYASGNTLILQAPSSHIIVDSTASVSSIDNLAYGSTLAVEIYGNVDNVYLEADESITSINVEGTVGAIDLYSKTNLTLSGKTTQYIPVNMEASAEASVLKTSIPFDMKANGSLDITLLEGSEGSYLKVVSEEVLTSITNDSAGGLNITRADNSEEIMGAGETREIGQAREEQSAASSQSSSTSSSSASTSSSSSSSGGSRSSQSSGSSSSAGTSQSSSSSSSTDTSLNNSAQNSTGTTNQTTETKTTTNIDSTKDKETKTEQKNNTSSTQTANEQEIKKLKDEVNNLQSELNKRPTEEQMKKEVATASAAAADEAVKEAFAALTYPLPDNIDTSTATETGNLIYRDDNLKNVLTYTRYQRAESDSTSTVANIPLEYIEITNHSTSSSYDVQIYYYYFNDKDQWVSIERDKSEVLIPGESRIFVRYAPGKESAIKFTGEIVATSKEKPKTNIVNKVDDTTELGTVFFEHYENLREENETIQLLFFDTDGKVVGFISHKIGGDVTDRNVSCGDYDIRNYVNYVDDSQVNNGALYFIIPNGAQSQKVYLPGKVNYLAKTDVNDNQQGQGD